MTMLPDEIQQESFRIIEGEVGPHPFAAPEWSVVRRLIHACGDLDIRHLVVFQQGAVEQGVAALRRGTSIVTDVSMVSAGIDRTSCGRLRVDVHCFIDDAEVRRKAEEKRSTRSRSAMEKAVALFPEAIYIIGNAPTALAAVCDAVAETKVRPGLLVAMPVGFVGVVESKERALSLDIPLIAVRGRKGGSALAAAAVNALLLLALEGRRP
jgi:precorrin-8X/cobalt-precorrin-8 methylmutase